jgi:hypothetical protein
MVLAFAGDSTINKFFAMLQNLFYYRVRLVAILRYNGEIKKLCAGRPEAG